MHFATVIALLLTYRCNNGMSTATPRTDTTYRIDQSIWQQMSLKQQVHDNLDHYCSLIPFETTGS